MTSILHIILLHFNILWDIYYKIITSSDLTNACLEHVYQLTHFVFQANAYTVYVSMAKLIGNLGTTLQILFLGREDTGVTGSDLTDMVTFLDCLGQHCTCTFFSGHPYPYMYFSLSCNC